MEFFEIKFDEDLIGIYVTYDPKKENEIKCALKTSPAKQMLRKADRLER